MFKYIRNNNRTIIFKRKRRGRAKVKNNCLFWDTFAFSTIFGWEKIILIVYMFSVRSRINATMPWPPRAHTNITLW